MKNYSLAEKIYLAITALGIVGVLYLIATYPYGYHGVGDTEWDWIAAPFAYLFGVPWLVFTIFYATAKVRQNTKTNRNKSLIFGGCLLIALLVVVWWAAAIFQEFYA